ncbi:hypothetical protein GH714_032480 [Hevea brasiliensis]|uniref:Phytocyanin domain-containing protein n=1 Tax=Hevea brasiliensis TaxID=3981 RepID=A0A6A6LNR7_HEVBR|nr:hypothetical protein GH714_032480 [Hevea brasiliensis]
MILKILFFKCASSQVVYTVGEDEGWNSEANFDSWSQKYNFSVGDVLVFKYVKGQHNVYEVTEDTFRSCDASNGVIAKYESGNDEIKLNKEKKYWFICNVVGHCLGGMRLNIDVGKGKQANSSSNGETIPQLEPTPPPTSSSSSSSFSVGIWICFLALRIFFKFFP